ncbi:hypothetical protein COU77_02890 [Candidatus Peregrinibacteria bacterium CG10_big_fil_rev_8_21_14_0_10_49_16]|nr:MAG: hypothetical protein COW95_02405 [Candidatus Peregrinibacteria bacterium CG22_combo_CG10-13_8_21_14_all_49_11]PIR51982.1 MAG: hypothetical protein COU77_02890 [Candidatus Peregrinibacteria bacterium CG10_big_fil_rev_8_21_14_0_10_49_16]
MCHTEPVKVQEQKSRLRQRMQNRIQRMTREEYTQESLSVCEQLRCLLPQHACAIAAFTPFSTEPDITPLLHELQQQHFTVYFPQWNNGDLRFSAGDKPLNPQLLTHALVPGRAFDASNRRLGRGQGHYDRWIRKQRLANPQTQFIGIAFSCQILSEVPCEDHDQIIDRVIHG